MFIPHTDADRAEMLRTVGIGKLDDLFRDVPERFRFPEINLPPAQSEMEIAAELQEMSHANESVRDLACFLGAGAYSHYVPAAVDAIIRRGEFLTAYTPYQPELSQGTLQAIFEYQSNVAALTGMEVCNASHYDGATAVAEAVNMAYANFRAKRNKIVLSPALHPQYRQTVRTYSEGSPLVFVSDEPGADLKAGPDDLIPLIDADTALVVVQYPDFFGRIFVHKLQNSGMGALLAISVNPIALGLLKDPGAMGADIVTGEGQPLGIPLSFGGPYLGLFATRKEYVRKMAGRLAGETVDNRGQRAYVLTLRPRAAHPAGEGHLQHLHQSGIDGSRLDGLHEPLRQEWTSPGCRVVFSQSSLRG
jgi:glycine dehydrogenase subunit 1